ncbi:unnamed protein product [Clonostachys solani]|uniref:NADPH--cytochrome P450 reductase n=1 Tax=Clonostachys solani TaxID=160281 RepID=A0A9P0EGZ1_9HYPO|nr:unnamed protein product [Clonostachys solani]
MSAVTSFWQVFYTKMEAAALETTIADCLVLVIVATASAYLYNPGKLIRQADPTIAKLFERPQLGLAGVRRVNDSRNIAEKMEETEADVVVFWGSQSGLAESLAHRLGREMIRRFKLRPLVADLSDYEPQTIALIPEGKLALFVMSTYGEGDPSDNAQEFVTWVKSRDVGASALKHIRYGAFGCGNRNYRFYNKVIRDVENCLDKAGAVPILPTGHGNEAEGTTEEVFVEWKHMLFSACKTKLGFTDHDAGYIPSVKVVQDLTAAMDDAELYRPLAAITASPMISRKAPIFCAPIKMRHTIASYSDKSRTCAHLVAGIASQRRVKYRTGDHLLIWPINPAEEVETLLHMVGLDETKDAILRIAPLDEHMALKVPSLTTAHALFSRHLEICAPVSRETIATLAAFAPTAETQSELIALSRDRDSYSEFLANNHVTLLRLLQYTQKSEGMTLWRNLPLSFMIDFLPAMKPRSYSISSSPVQSPREISLSVSVKPTPLVGKPDVLIPGLTSSFLSGGISRDEDMSRLSSIYMQVKTSSFKLPIKPAVPIIMVAAGTGIAPFRAFLQDRAHVATVGHEVGPMILFFGCQSEDDYLYKDELDSLKHGPLVDRLEVVPAFSRSPDHEKMYVNHQVEAKAEQVGQWLVAQGAAIYICGAATMATLVREVVLEAVKAETGWSMDETEAWRLDCKKSRKWHEDVWSETCK